MNKFLEQFSQFQRREQIILLVCGVALVFYIFWIALISPLQHKRDLLIRTTDVTEQSLGRVRLLVRQLQVAGSQGSQNAGANENLSGLIDSSLQENGGMKMSSFTPGPGGEARVRIDKANSESLMQWLYDMEVKHQVQIRELSITALNEPGQVSVNVRLIKP